MARLDVSFHVAGCVNHCRHCYARQGPPAGDLVSVDDILYVDRQVAATGMEADIGFLSSPLAHSGWRDILRLCREHHGEVQAPINGIPWRQDEDWRPAIREARSLGLWGVQLSLYGMGRVHDEFAGADGDFERSVAAARRFMECGVTVWCIQVFAHYGNAAQLEELLEFARRLQQEDPSAEHVAVAPRVRLVLPSFAGRWCEAGDLVLTVADVDSLPSGVRSALGDGDLRTESEWLAATAAGDVSPAGWAGDRASHRDRVGLWVDPSLTVRRRVDARETLGSLRDCELGGIVEECLCRPDPELERFAAMGDGQIARRCGVRDGERLYAREDVFRKWFHAAWGTRAMGEDVARDRRQGGPRGASHRPDPPT